MKLSIHYNHCIVCCGLSMATGWTADVRVDIDLLDETLAYAAMRLISKSRTRRIMLRVPGEALTLPGTAVFLCLNIRAEGITVERIRVLPVDSSAAKTAAHYTVLLTSWMLNLLLQFAPDIQSSIFRSLGNDADCGQAPVVPVQAHPASERGGRPDRDRS